MCAKIVKSKKVIVGITGNIASGKTTALKYLSSLGFKTINSDEIVNKIWSDKEFNKIISNEYNVNLEDRKSKKRFFNKIYENPILRKEIEDRIHPKVFSEIETNLQNEMGIIFIEMPLLYEVNFHHKCNYVILILTSQDKQNSRLEKRGLSNNESKIRIDSQKNFLFMNKAKYYKLLKKESLNLGTFEIYNITKKIDLFKSLDKIIEEIQKHEKNNII
jgi:dephospho-CoA kinase